MSLQTKRQKTQLQHCYSTTVEEKTSEVEPGDKVGLLLRDFPFDGHTG